MTEDLAQFSAGLLKWLFGVSVCLSIHLDVINKP